jgi:integrase
MRGAAKKPPKYCRHKASGQAVVSINGKDYYLGPYGTKASKLEYDRLIGEWLSNSRQMPTADRLLSVSELCAAYLRFAKGYYVKNGEPTDEQGCIRMAIRHTRKLYGKQPVSEFGPKALKAVRRVMIDRGNSRKYVNSNVNRIRRMFKWGVANELVPADVHLALTAVDGLKAGKSEARETGPVLPVSDAVMEATIAHCSKTVAAMIRFQRLTGCRPGEVRSIRPCDIDRTNDIWLYTPEGHKMEHKGRARVIPIGPKAQAVLAPHLLRGDSEHCFTRPRTNDMFKRWSYNEAIHAACDKAFPSPEGIQGVELKAWRKANRWAPNQLRHAAATEVRAKFGLEGSQVTLGHASADVTQIYAERDLQKAVEIARKVG